MATFDLGPLRLVVTQGERDQANNRSLISYAFDGWNGRAIIGFGAGRGYEFSEFLADLEAAGLTLGLALSTWDLRPFTADSDFLVAVCER